MRSPVYPLPSPISATAIASSIAITDFCHRDRIIHFHFIKTRSAPQPEADHEE
jgi:hypothetical protein